MVTETNPPEADDESPVFPMAALNASRLRSNVSATAMSFFSFLD